MKKNRLILALLAPTLTSLCASAQETTKWIVTGRDAASRAQTVFADKPLLKDGQPAFSVLESKSDRIVARATDSAIAAIADPTLHRCGGYTVHDSYEAAVAEVNNPFYAANVNLEIPFPATIDQQVDVTQALDLISKTEIMDTIAVLANLGTRFYESDEGQNAAILIEERWKAYAAGRPDFSVARFVHNWKQNSVIATIEGSDHPEEIVLIGAHLDSIHPADNSNAPGADDDATGVAVVSEVLRVLAKINFAPKRTLQFMAYAAEEVGLRGSQDIARRYKTEGKKVVAALQFDMAGYAGSEKNMYFISDEEYVNKELTDYLKSLVSAYNNSGVHEITHGDTECGYGCSDHVSWTGIGVPSAFPFEAAFANTNSALHTSMDVIARMDATGVHQSRFAKLGVEFMIETGKSSNARLHQMSVE